MFMVFYFYETAAYKGTNNLYSKLQFPGPACGIHNKHALGIMAWLGIIGIMPSRHRHWFHQQQQDPNALLSQSLGASSNSEHKTVQILVENCLYFYFSDHDRINPAVNDLTFHKISKAVFTWSSFHVYGSLLSNQIEPSNVHKNWILWHLPLKNNICTPVANHRWCLVILICVTVRYSKL